MSGQDAWKDSAGRNEEHWIDQEWRLVQPMCVGPTWVVVDEQGMVRVGETPGLFKSGR
jgi:hypothetical protein